MTIAEDKQKLRRAMKARLASLTPDFWVDASKAVCDRLMGSSLWDGVGVLGYWALAGEVELSGAMGEALKEGRKVFCPRVNWETGSMEAARVMRWGIGEGGVEIGRFGVGEPRRDAEAAVRDEVGLVLVPGVAFDGKGMRLGRGRGFYDRYLSENRGETRVVGIAIEEQLVDDVPHEAWDVAMDAIVTQRRVIEVRKR